MMPKCYRAKHPASKTFLFFWQYSKAMRTSKYYNRFVKYYCGKSNQWDLSDFFAFLASLQGRHRDATTAATCLVSERAVAIAITEQGQIVRNENKWKMIVRLYARSVAQRRDFVEYDTR